MAEQGAQAGEEEVRNGPRNNAESLVVPVQILAQLAERSRRPVQEIRFSGEREDWPAYMTRLLACAENENIAHTLDRSIVDKLPSTGIVLEKGNPNHLSQIRAVEDCARMMNIFMLAQTSVAIINGIAAIKAHGRKLGSPYEVWKWMKAKFAPGGDIAEMKMESELNALKLDADEDPKTIEDKIAGVLVKYSCTISMRER